jgi:branched-chain amino acid transport system substrate-binding protein
MTVGTRVRKVQVVGAVSLTAAIVLTACSSSKGTTSSDSSGTSSTTPLRVMVIEPKGTNGLNYDYVFDAVKVAAARINSGGGVKGQQIQVDFCNDQRDPNVATKCAGKAKSNGDIAVIGGFTGLGAAELPTLDAANIAWFAPDPVGTVDAQSRDAYPIAGGSTGAQFGVGAIAASRKPKKFAVLRLDLDSSAAAQKFMAAGLKLGGQDVAATVSVPYGTPDMSAQAQTLKSEGVDAVGMILDSQSTGRAVSAFEALNYHPTIYTTVPSLPVNTKSYSGGFENLVAASSYPISGSTYAQFAADMTPTGRPVDEIGFNGYVGTFAFAKIASGMSGKITAKSFRDAVNQTNSLQVFPDLPTVDLTNETTLVPDAPRLFNINVWTNTITSGKLVPGQRFDPSTVK